MALATVTNTSGAAFAAGDLPGPLAQFAIASAGNVVTGISKADLLEGEDKGSPVWKQLDRLIQTGQITIAVASPGTGDTPATTLVSMLDEMDSL